MHRPRIATGFLLAPIVIVFAFFTFACGSAGPEKQVLDGFFRASKLRDTATLANIAIAQFDVNTQGVVENYSIVSTTPERVEPLHLKELAKLHDEAKAADDEFTKKKRAYQDEHADDVKAYLDMERGKKPEKKLSSEFQATWKKWVDDTKESARKVSEAREKLSAERTVADISTYNASNPIDATMYEGELATKEVTINANVMTPDKQHVNKTMVVTIQQARLKGDKPITGKWILTKIADQNAAGKTN